MTETCRKYTAHHTYTVEGRAFSSGFEVETTESETGSWVGRRRRGTGMCACVCVCVCVCVCCACRVC